MNESRYFQIKDAYPQMIECKICKSIHTSNLSLSKHVKFIHKLSSKEYYDLYVNTDTHVCPVCNNTNENFKNINLGYTETCSRKCSAILFRRRLKEDTTKTEVFVNKVKNNMLDFHKNMSNEDKDKRLLKIKNSVNNFNKTLSTEEKIEIYGWMNKISDDDRKTFIENVMLKTGCHLWWKTASEEQKFNARIKSTTAIMNYVRPMINEEEYVKGIKSKYIPLYMFDKLEVKLGIVDE